MYFYHQDTHKLTMDQLWPLQKKEMPKPRTTFPSPFARITCRFGAPIAVRREASPEDEERIARELDAALDGLTDELDGSRGLRARAEA